MDSAHPEFVSEFERVGRIIKYLAEYRDASSIKKREIDGLVAYSLKHFNSDNAEQFTELVLNLSNQEYLEQKLKEAGKAILKPYFARVDFTEDGAPGENGKNRLYIGKMTLMDDKSMEILITDWRAPVSTLYYEGRIGRSSYECPDGAVSGEITLKRQYSIENGVLLEMNDVDITTNDDFLQAALGASKDMRLKDIVSTIQAEQNKIIRSGLYSPLIVQGAAGSGKTTIALHRIAYLLYAHSDKLKARQFMIMAPNKLFLSYISEVLPELGVDNVAQTTFEEFAVSYIGSKIKAVNSIHNLSEAVERGDYENDSLKLAGLKSTLKYKKLVERHCRSIVRNLLPKEDFRLGPYESETFVIIGRDEITKLLLEEYAYLPMEQRIGELKKNLTNSLKRRKPLIMEDIDERYDRMKNEIKRKMEDSDERRALIGSLLDKRDKILNYMGTKSKTAVRDYLRGIKMKTAVHYYTSLYENRKRFERLAEGLFMGEQVELLWRGSRAALESGAFNNEDLPALMTVKRMLFAPEDSIEARHIVIDEAQDYSLYQFAVLKDILKSESFSLLGDIRQGIHAYKGVTDWNGMISRIFPDKSDFLTLRQSYRTTVEIMEAANKVINRLDFADAPGAVPVLRRGKPVRVTENKNYGMNVSSIDDELIEMQKNGYRSVAVITKTAEEGSRLKKDLKAKLRLISAAGNVPQNLGNLMILPGYLAKGLEFDAVIISDASDANYSAHPVDVKLLYISMTRALHELVIFSVGERAAILRQP